MDWEADVVTTDVVTTNAITYVIKVDVITTSHFILLVKDWKWATKEAFLPPNTTPMLGGSRKQIKN